jgi:hypothetical protein
MKEAFIEKRFGSNATDLIRTINGILDEYEQEGYDLSLRQLFYQLVSRNVVPNTEKSYKNVGGLVSDARLAGLIDWDIIKDRGREMIQNSHWESPAEIVRTAASQFRIDRWKDQPRYVEVMVEKQALEGVLVPVCKELDVPFTANKGYSSSSAMYEASKRFLQRAEAGKELYILYLGDHDPSGIDMTRDVLDRLDLFVKTSMNRCDEIGPNEIPAVEVRRLALNMEQIEELRPPENPAKLTDSRATGYVQRFGTSSWELDAIEPRRLASIVRQSIRSLLNIRAWNASGSRQDAMRAELTEFADNYQSR